MRRSLRRLGAVVQIPLTRARRLESLDCIRVCLFTVAGPAGLCHHCPPRPLSLSSRDGRRVRTAGGLRLHTTTAGTERRDIGGRASMQTDRCGQEQRRREARRDYSDAAWSAYDPTRRREDLSGSHSHGPRRTRGDRDLSTARYHHTPAAPNQPRRTALDDQPSFIETARSATTWSPLRSGRGERCRAWTRAAHRPAKDRQCSSRQTAALPSVWYPHLVPALGTRTWYPQRLIVARTGPSKRKPRQERGFV